MPTGCALCWPDDAADAWESDARVRTKELIDESHFHVTILVCTACRQKFVSVFTEMVDWVDGNDPQYWSLLPITPTEAVMLARDPPTEEALHRMGHGRRSLGRAYDKDDAEPRCFWSKGVRAAPHD